MKKWIGLTALVLLLAAIGGYVYLAGRETVLRFSEADIQQQLDAKLPQTRTFYLLIQVTLEQPGVRFAEDTDRIRAGLDVSLNLSVGKERRPLGGSIDVTTGIRYAPDKGQFFLSNPVVEQLTIEGVPAKYLDKAEAAVTDALTSYFATQPVYTLKQSDVRQAAARLVLKDVQVEDGTLLVRLGL